MHVPIEFPNSRLSAALKLRGFKVHRSNNLKSGLTAFGRRHFYKIVFSIGHVRVHYGNRILELDGTYLFFANTHVPYAAEILSEAQPGYACVFTDSFIKPLERSESLQQSPLFKVSVNPTLKLNEQQQIRLIGIFDSMIAEEATDYLYKDDLMRNYIQLIIHEALRMRPAELSTQFKTASLRVANQFLELLERQFPIENSHAPLKLKTALDYAGCLSIHVNYLNRAVKEVTGKPTTMLIAERLTAEAVNMIQHTDWNVAEIAYALGFEYPNNFSSFFKKMTGNIPKAYRAV